MFSRTFLTPEQFYLLAIETTEKTIPKNSLAILSPYLIVLN